VDSRHKRPPAGRKNIKGCKRGKGKSQAEEKKSERRGSVLSSALWITGNTGKSLKNQKRKKGTPKRVRHEN